MDYIPPQWVVKIIELSNDHTASEQNDFQEVVCTHPNRMVGIVNQSECSE